MAEARTYTCAACSQPLAASAFSKGQLRKGAAKRCASCVATPQEKTIAPAAVADDGTATKHLLVHELAAKIIDTVDGGVGVRTALYEVKVPNKL